MDGTIENPWQIVIYIRDVEDAVPYEYLFFYEKILKFQKFFHNFEKT